MPYAGSVNQIDPSERTHHVVRAVQPLAVVAIGEDGDRAVVLGAGDPAVAVLARHQPAVGVERVAVGVAGRMAEHADRASGLVPAQQPIVGDVADEEVATGRDVHRALRPPAPDVKALDAVVALDVAEALVEHLELGRNAVADRPFLAIPDASGVDPVGRIHPPRPKPPWRLNGPRRGEHGADAAPTSERAQSSERWAQRDSNPRLLPCKGSALAN